MTHIDLFSGIGGFALAGHRVWGKAYQTLLFCDNDEYCKKLLSLRFPGVPIYGDIRELVADTKNQRRKRVGLEWQPNKKTTQSWVNDKIDLLTGGFPCQPFSLAGKRKGTEDDRHLWPEMFKVIRNTSPRWVVAENVYGLVSWNEGMVFEQVCTDLESEGYEVQSFIIPACAVNAPHRRNRVWVVAHAKDNGSGRGHRKKRRIQKRKLVADQQKRNKARRKSKRRFGWETNWLKVATKLCGVDDGLPARVDEFELSKAGHRNVRLKGLGNAIVPQVAEQIFISIKNCCM